MLLQPSMQTQILEPSAQKLVEMAFPGFQMETAAVVKELKHSGGHPILASAWGPAGQPLVSCEKNGTVTFWSN